MLLNSDKQFVKNYFNNPRAENGVYSWNLYNDGAATRPVNGTGGVASGDFNVTTSASAPIEGARSLHLVKAASNMQGYGFSTDMAIDLTLQGKMCQVRFDYRIVAGTFSGSGVNTVDSDLIVYFYDVTNSALIEPSCIVMDGANTGLTFTYKGNIQIPTNCASLRFIIHQAKNTSATGYTLDFDNFTLSEQIAVQGAPVSDWKTYTPVLTWVAGITSSEGWYRRVGDNMECKIKIVTSGAVTATTLYVSLPTGHSIDTTKLQTAGTSGVVMLPQATGYAREVSPAAESMLSAYLYSSTQVAPCYLISSTANLSFSAINATAPWTWANTDSIEFSFSVPILGWSTSTSISGVDAADGRLVAFKAYRNAAFTTLDPNANWKQIPFDAVLHDSHLAFNTTSFRFVCPVAGTYSFNAGIDIASTNVLANIYAIGLYKNGALVEGAELSTKIVTTRFKAIGAFSPQKSIAGDYYEVFLYGAGNNSSNKLTIIEGVEVTYFGGYRLPSTTSISSGETVAASYNTAAGQSIPNTGDNVINFGTKVYDTHSAVTNPTSAFKFYAPLSGKYNIKCAISYSALVYAVSNIQELYIYKNGAKICTIGQLSAETTTACYQSNLGSASINMLAGDYIEIKAYNNRAAGATTLFNDSVYNHVEIERIGA